MTDHDLPTRTEGEGDTLDMPEGLGTFTTGQVLGERYQILEMLGRGGMGEVWHAFDLKLRVEVALKALREDLFKSERRLEMLRDEVRAAREVVSPNVCRIFDLIEIESRELVSMEHVDGATLLGVLQERGPLDLKEAQDIASQFLAGLEAIHKVGLVHRDIKPENIMLTRAGRVVVMDFGLARDETEGGGSVSGTPAYMAPEQAAGQTLDARADVYSAGVVLAEMVSPEGIKSYESRQSVWEGVRSEPAKLPDSPWAPAIKKAVARDRERRFNTAHTLVRALEDVTLRVEGAEDLHPYPGLASFTEDDAEYFFGREAEVEEMWATLQGPPRLLGLVGPSGAGKTSFLRAGLLPNSTPEWTISRTTPGSSPFVALGQALAPGVAGNSEAMNLLPQVQEIDAAVALVSSWSRRSPRALLIIDQFEELFTLNPDDMQASFADFLARLPLETDVHVLLSMRDDFLMHCSRHEAFRPMVKGLTLLDSPSGSSLRRALTQPATKCGYRFEDDELVDEMLAEVEGERGALPLLAFAAARLWEMRDRDTGNLTRQAHNDIGGVGGALARHAEATIDRIGSDHIAIVRELFRNLVTAEGTRTAREWDELLSVFPENQRESADDILRELISARLLTSYEIHVDEEDPTRRVEIIHESLLANWPRLVRWQTQDQEGAQLRDELRQSARAWDEHGHHDDRLWTGTAYREYALWRERYPGGLTVTEEAFGAAMTLSATRRKRRRRLTAVVGVTVLLGVLGVVTTLWQHSVQQTLRAEAQKLVTLGQLELGSYPSAAVAFATAGLELADTPESRLLAIEALWEGPTAFEVNQDNSWDTEFSPDNRWLIQARTKATSDRGCLSIIGANGSNEFLGVAHPGAVGVRVAMTADATHFVSYGSGDDTTMEFILWSIPEGQRLADIRYKNPAYILGIAGDVERGRFILLVLEDDRAVVDALGFDGSVKRIGALDFQFENPRQWWERTGIDERNGRWIGAVKQNKVLVFDIRDDKLTEQQPLGHVDGVIVDVTVDPLGRFVSTTDAKGKILLWSLTEALPPAVLQGPPEIRYLRITPDGSLLQAAAQEGGEWAFRSWALSEIPPRPPHSFNLGDTSSKYWEWDTKGRQVARLGPDLKIHVWSMDAPADADPLILNRSEIMQMNYFSFNPEGRWLAAADSNGLAAWPLLNRLPFIFRRHDADVMGLVFSPGGSWLASSSADGTVRMIPLEGSPPPRGRILMELDSPVFELAASQDGERILAGTGSQGVRVFRLDGVASSTLEGFTGQSWGVAFSADGQLAAAAGGRFNPAERVIRVWDVASGDEVTVLEVGERPQVDNLQFTPEGYLLSASASGLLRWNLHSGKRELLYAGDIIRFSADANGRKVVMVAVEREANVEARTYPLVLDVESRTTTRLEAFGVDVMSVALDPEGAVLVTGDRDGEVRVGPLSAVEPHLLLGHETTVWTVAIDPLGRWIASGGKDTTVRLWPMPDLSKPPLHTLPREELIAKLKTLTNLRVVRDEESATGWKLTHDPFPGWETVPTW